MYLILKDDGQLGITKHKPPLEIMQIGSRAFEIDMTTKNEDIEQWAKDGLEDTDKIKECI